jgi:acetyl-CoA carboxylase alpha subunit
MKPVSLEIGMANPEGYKKSLMKMAENLDPVVTLIDTPTAIPVVGSRRERGQEKPLQKLILEMCRLSSNYLWCWRRCIWWRFRNRCLEIKF